MYNKEKLIKKIKEEMITNFLFYSQQFLLIYPFSIQ